MPFGSIESKHGVDEPEPSWTRAQKLEDTGAKLQSTGQQVSSCGGSLVRLGCSGFLLLFVVAVAVSVLSGGNSGGTPASTGTTEEEHTTSTESAPELRIGSTATLKGEQSSEQVEATVLAYKESIQSGNTTRRRRG